MKDLMLLFFILCILSACKDDDNMMEPFGETPCMFVQDDSSMDGLIDEQENNIMSSCFDNRITSEAALRANTIGTWELIGFAQGWFPNVLQPCATMIFTADELEYSFTNASLDTTLTMAWSVVEHSSVEGFYELEFERTDLPAVELNIYCEEYMYSNLTPLDGNMYIFERKQ
jgi:hypothetical protein